MHLKTSLAYEMRLNVTRWGNTVFGKRLRTVRNSRTRSLKALLLDVTS